MKSHRIQPLPPQVAAQIKSSTSITNLNGVIVELVKNSLDANACTIFVTVDYRRGGCVVEDDGDGILRAEFEPDGGLGGAHHTSKLHADTPIYGKRGLFLASLSSLAVLTITSHHASQPCTNTVIFHHSTPIARLTPAPVHQELRFSDHGTRVTVNDLFGNMPVRVKYRALSMQKPDELARQWDDLRHLLISFMIPNDRLLKLVISDIDNERRLTIRPRKKGPQAGNELDLVRLGSILSQAGLADFQSNNGWYFVSACVPQVSIQAALSLVPSPSKKIQFISLGIDPIFPRNHANMLFSEVNRLFDLSDFGTAGCSSFGTDNAPLSLQIDRHGLHTKPIPKTVNKWPMFYIRIDANGAPISSDDQDIPESDKSLQRIIDVVTVMINEFLKEHNMRPRGGKRKRKCPTDEGDRHPSKSETDKAARVEETLGKQLRLPLFSRPKISPHFGNWSRIKGASSRSSRFLLPATQIPGLFQASPDGPNNVPSKPTSEANGIFDSTVGDSNSGVFQAPDAVESQGSKTDKSETDIVIPWIDPYSGVSYLVNSRTGQSINVQSPVAVALTSRPRSTGSFGVTRVLDSLKRPASVPLSRPPSNWVENLLDGWENPTFARCEQPINALEFNAGHDGSLDAQAHYNSEKPCGLESFGVSKFRGKLRKQDLDTAEIIGQVDRKFILARVTTSRGSDGDTPTLVLIDQHAADERCRVERLFEELFQISGDLLCVQTIQVDPIVFDIPATEALIFKERLDFFKSWGIEYAVQSSLSSRNATVSVLRLPTLIAERCRVEADLAMNVIRGEIWRQEGRNSTRPQTPPGPGQSQKHDSWVGRLAGCPRGILDLLNSRACRTAIMFNDVLSIEECQNLVRQLSRCVFPFQCAHGRPSMVPVLDLPGALDAGQRDEYININKQGVGYTEAFQRWQL
ncbi:hypothetical protein P175DRAFT_0512502 [Aspergillus ochraceoroseus IBT 24754]|uniref:MutL C-terminal dimerisation domain-containing protein n=2 Tax=Aspergillus ochraceoroseus TaxID=138278 RepID=A0A2T5LM62_9EURO|nr:uncharacterized protein P175DRAFT_0512502 [Aspergillus ochraceoroseus IBT 24754]KKK21887.1 hypothetical protein AOCH_006104 [Aspergillus ochraceoroseus]PTU17370.1 hypothetical protein P175DRAFT_0512502 [Aspergillus ochraceoroseus IBT 24754]